MAPIGVSPLDTLDFHWQPTEDPEFLLKREWLVTNGLGGYASGTLLGVPTRRYHGFLVANLPAPHGRTVMMPHVEERVVAEEMMVRISALEHEDGRLNGAAPTTLTEFRLEGLLPVWRFSVSGRVIEKRIVMPHGFNTVYVCYNLISGPPVALQLQPFIDFRMHDAPLSPKPSPGFRLIAEKGRYEVRASEEAAALRLCLRPEGGLFIVSEGLRADVLYRNERDRGYQSVETLHSPGYFEVQLDGERQIAMVASVEEWALLGHEPDAVIEHEQARQEKLIAAANRPAASPIERQLVLAADQFLIRPASRPEEEVTARAEGDEVRTVVAGYHWFTDWGRDTMISLEGLTLCTGRHAEARTILLTFAHYVKDGLLPNLFPEGQRTALYHTADATLWFFHAIDRYVARTGDREILSTLHRTLRSIAAHHIRGTRFGIGIDPADGLLRAGAEGLQLTWMDAKVDDWVVTPRRGKPVEIQALWYNALRLLAEWYTGVEEPDEQWTVLADQARASFNRRFWHAAGGYLYDVVDGETGDDPSLRPNQVIALALRHPILDESRWTAVVDVVARRLLTPVGLRSLASDHPDYKATYFGDLRARDAAYHQGTVWAWLIGPFVDARRRADGDGTRVRAMLDGFERHLQDAGIGTISEIFDAEAPFTPRGCIAQAWSVAEVLRALQLTCPP